MVVAEFLNMIKAEKGLSANTLESYKSDLKRFSDFFKNRELSHLTETDILKYIETLKKNAHERTVARHITALKQFYLFLVRDQVISKSPMRHIKAPSWHKNLPKFLDACDVVKLLDAARSLPDQSFSVMLELLYATGMRISELITLPKSHVLKQEGMWSILIKGKGGKERIVPIHTQAQTVLEHYLTTITTLSPFLFPSRYASRQPITRQRFAQKLKEIAVTAGIDPEKISPHIIRHAFATHMLQNGANLMLIKEFLGHANLSTSEIYLHVLPDDLKEFVEKHHPIVKM